MDELDLQLFVFRNFLNFQNLSTTQGEKVKIFDIGDLNYDAGPDFINSRISLSGVQWFGNIEIHIKSSDWEKHMHSKNAMYDVILHIVLEQDKQIFKKDNSPLPTLEIKKYWNKSLKDSFSENKLCDLHKLHEIFPMLILHRMKRKNDFIISLLNDLQGNWENTAFNFLMYNFGFKVNNEQMLQLALSIDYKVVQKNKDDEQSLLALLAGQGDLLEFFDEKLSVKYDFLKQKYDLQKPKILWNYSKIHPQNFPEIRIQQVVKLICNKSSLLEWLSDDENLEEEKFLSKQTLNHMKINTTIPLQFSYNQYYCKPNKHILEKLRNTQAEENKITRSWKKLGIKISNGYESQALIELTNNMCKKNKCLICPLIGKKNNSNSLD